MQIRTAHTLMALLALAGLGLAGTSASPKPSAPAVKAGVIQLRGVEIDRTKREIHSDRDGRRRCLVFPGITRSPFLENKAERQPSPARHM